VNLVADASSLIAELMRVRGRRLLQHSELQVLVADEHWAETERGLAERATQLMRRMPPENVKVLMDAALSLADTGAITVVPRIAYAEWEPIARGRIRDATDWPTLALALAIGAPVLTNDADFLGCGVSTWSAEALLAELEGAESGPRTPLEEPEPIDMTQVAERQEVSVPPDNLIRRYNDAVRRFEAAYETGQGDVSSSLELADLLKDLLRNGFIGPDIEEVLESDAKVPRGSRMVIRKLELPYDVPLYWWQVDLGRIPLYIKCWPMVLGAHEGTYAYALQRRGDAPGDYFYLATEGTLASSPADALGRCLEMLWSGDVAVPELSDSALDDDLG
jgi:predicted nucleic acid-binding protein